MGYVCGSIVATPYDGHSLQIPIMLCLQLFSATSPCTALPFMAEINSCAIMKPYVWICVYCRHPGRTLVFVNAVTALRRVAALLKLLGMPVHALHAQQQQRQRLKVSVCVVCGRDGAYQCMRCMPNSSNGRGQWLLYRPETLVKSKISQMRRRRIFIWVKRKISQSFVNLGR